MSVSLFFRLEYVDFLIRTKSTGQPKDLARKLKVSERTLYDVILLMRNLGAPVAYCKQKKTYYYLEEGIFVFRFQKHCKLEKFSSSKSNFSEAIVLLFFFCNLLVENATAFFLV